MKKTGINNRIYLIFTFVTLLCFNGVIVKAQCHSGSSSHSSHSEYSSNENELAAPHGGILKKAGKYYIELVVNMIYKEDKISIYLLNKSGIPKDSSNLSGTISFLNKAGDFTDYSLYSIDEQKWGVKADVTGNFRCNIVFKSGKKTYSSVFDYNSIEYQNAGYHCPMHPEVSGKTPGTCSKCGMDLIKNK